MTDWRYWITYEGIVSAESERDATNEAIDTVYAAVHGDLLYPIPTVEVEAIDNAGN